VFLRIRWWIGGDLRGEGRVIRLRAWVSAGGEVDLGSWLVEWLATGILGVAVVGVLADEVILEGGVWVVLGGRCCCWAGECVSARGTLIVACLVPGRGVVNVSAADG